jgi:hypothetical protein
MAPRRVHEGAYLADVWPPSADPTHCFTATGATLAEVEIHEGNRDPAVAAATTAYRLAWCDGPPFACETPPAGVRLPHRMQLDKKRPVSCKRMV